VFGKSIRNGEYLNITSHRQIIKAELTGGTHQIIAGYTDLLIIHTIANNQNNIAGKG
jgi:hypothetical protein